MGWKAFKDHYRISHFVHVEHDCICIGSPYIHDIIRVGMDGVIVKRGGSGNDDLARYQKEIDDDPDKDRYLIAQTDTFEKSIPVFVYDGEGHVITKFCEETGWPNVTHDGELMYNNTFSTVRAKVIAWAVRNEECTARLADENLERLRDELMEAEQWKREAQRNLDLLRRLSDGS